MKILGFLLSAALLTNPAFAQPTDEQQQQEVKRLIEKSFEAPYGCQYSLKGCGLSAPIDFSISNEQANKIGISSKEFGAMLDRQDPHRDFKSYYIPVPITDKELITLVAATSLGFVIFSQDQELMNFVQERRTETTQKFANVGNIFGSEAIPPIAIGSFFLGAVIKDGKLKKLGIYTVAAGLATQLVTEMFKKAVNRVRPNRDVGPYEFGVSGNYSFFSGHSSGAWSFATVIAHIYKDTKWVPYVAYGMAALTSYARVHDKKHWVTDVLAGAVAGHLITKVVLRIMEREDDDNGNGLLIYPAYNKETKTYMMNVSMSFGGGANQNLFKCVSMPNGMAKVEACIQEAVKKSDKKKLF